MTTQEIVRECSGLVTAAGLHVHTPAQIARYQAIQIIESRRDPASIEYAPDGQDVLIGVHEYLVNPAWRYAAKERDGDDWSMALDFICLILAVILLLIVLVVL